ncbi:hypothetical protein D9758_015732 [Tetrapyrgos nigripes]|uniref:Cytochrome P450 n=1 Tax=Tetrapyrgos nigripes TaxID=182062 RepID=A0A8H5CRR3_9AGAR|nr:hypothetical protein D9758_015732 [Tetrapyrgos nigripes]
MDLSSVTLPLVVALSVLLFLRRHNNRRSYSLANLPGPKSRSWWRGNFGEALNSDAWKFHEQLLKEYGQIARIDGFMGDKQLLIFDPKAMHHVLVKDATMYEGTSVTDNALIIGKGLSGITGNAHRKQRKALNPVFSIAHMRDMVPIFWEVVDKLESGLSAKFTNDRSSSQPQEIEMLSWMSRTALELIGQAGLGYSFDNLSAEAEAHPYPGIIKQLHITGGRMWFVRNYVLQWALKIGTPSFRRRVLDMIPWKDGHHMRDMSDYSWEMSKQIYDGKKKALAEGDEAVAQQVGKGKDIMGILMRLNTEEEHDSENKLDEDEVVGQMAILVFAAMDTTSGALARILYLLAAHPEVQDKLRREILEVRSENKHISYDQLVSDLPYLDAICRETLRLFPPLPHVFRYALQDTVLPLSTPITGNDGTPITELHVPKDTRIMISILNSNRNPAIWGPDALEWKPERWLSPLPNEVVEAHIPGVYSHLYGAFFSLMLTIWRLNILAFRMTFNAGRRSCIGFKFSQLEMILSMLVAEFEFSPSQKDVFWQMNSITMPALEGNRQAPQLPLIVNKI